VSSDISPDAAIIALIVVSTLSLVVCLAYLIFRLVKGNSFFNSFC